MIGAQHPGNAARSYPIAHRQRWPRVRRIRGLSGAVTNTLRKVGRNAIGPEAGRAPSSVVHQRRGREGQTGLQLTGQSNERRARCKAGCRRTSAGSGLRRLRRSKDHAVAGHAA